MNFVQEQLTTANQKLFKQGVHEKSHQQCGKPIRET